MMYNDQMRQRGSSDSSFAMGDVSSQQYAAAPAYGGGSGYGQPQQQQQQWGAGGYAAPAAYGAPNAYGSTGASGYSTPGYGSYPASHAGSQSNLYGGASAGVGYGSSAYGGGSAAYGGSSGYGGGSSSSFGGYGGGGSSRGMLSDDSGRSFLGKLGGILKGRGVGVTLIILSCLLLVWNEGSVVGSSVAFQEGLELCQTVNSRTPLNKVANSLVHVTGVLQTDANLRDPIYDVSVHAARLRRVVEMLQWQERSEDEHSEEDEDAEHRRPLYTLGWHEHIIDSSNFQDQSKVNPTEMSVTSMEWVCKVARVGQFILSNELIGQIDNWRELRLTRELDGMALRSNMLFSGRDRSPVPGDIRIRFEYAGIGMAGTEQGPQDTVTLVATVGKTGKLRGFETSSGEVLEMLKVGAFSKEEMFDVAVEESSTAGSSWLLRVLGWLLLWGGLLLADDIVSGIISWIPLLSNMVSLSRVGFTFALSTVISLFIVALGWMSHRPIVTILVLGAVVVVLFFAIKKGRNQKRRIE